LKETDLYAPIKRFFETNGYTVRAEVRDCDVVAMKGDDMVVVELKTSANMELLVQATDRQRISESVYVAVPAPETKKRSTRRSSHWKGVKRILRQLELGLITVDPARIKPVQVVFDPLPYRRRKVSAKRRAVITEVAERSGDYNVAGSTRTKLVTAYRESAIYVAWCLREVGPTTPGALRNLGTGARTTSILSSNFYGWFQRIARGTYQITAKGTEDLWTYPEIANLCRAKLEEQRNAEPEASA
jgi:hypothetical protein